MSAISSISTLPQVQAAYDDNASYAEDGSIPKARAFITAARILLRRLPDHSTPEASLRFRVDLIQSEIREAQKWLDNRDGGDAAVAGGTARTTRGSFKNFRD